jgi:hypothetical protein
MKWIKKFNESKIVKRKYRVPKLMTKKELLDFLQEKGWIEDELAFGGLIINKKKEKFTQYELDFFTDFTKSTEGKVTKKGYDIEPFRMTQDRNQEIKIKNRLKDISIDKREDGWYFISYIDFYGDTDKKSGWFVCDGFEEVKGVFQQYLKYSK